MPWHYSVTSWRKNWRNYVSFDSYSCIGFLQKTALFFLYHIMTSLLLVVVLYCFFVLQTVKKVRSLIFLFFSVSSNSLTAQNMLNHFYSIPKFACRTKHEYSKISHIEIPLTMLVYKPIVVRVNSSLFPLIWLVIFTYALTWIITRIEMHVKLPDNNNVTRSSQSLGND